MSSKISGQQFHGDSLFPGWSGMPYPALTVATWGGAHCSGRGSSSWTPAACRGAGWRQRCPCRNPPGSESVNRAQGCAPSAPSYITPLQVMLSRCAPARSPHLALPVSVAAFAWAKVKDNRQRCTGCFQPGKVPFWSLFSVMFIGFPGVPGSFSFSFLFCNLSSSLPPFSFFPPSLPSFLS